MTGDGGGGGGDGGGKDLKATGLDLVAKGLTEALAELKELGMVGEAGAGRGFSDIALSGLELGHEGLTGDFKSFCERWEWGVRSLVDEGNAFAAEVPACRQARYYETEQYVEGSFKVVANSAIGNPYASEDDVTKKGWGDIAKSGAYGDPDYSKESFDQAMANSAQGWKDAGRDMRRPILRVRWASIPRTCTGSGRSDDEYDEPGSTTPSAPPPRSGPKPPGSRAGVRADGAR